MIDYNDPLGTEDREDEFNERSRMRGDDKVRDKWPVYRHVQCGSRIDFLGRCTKCGYFVVIGVEEVKA